MISVALEDELRPAPPQVKALFTQMRRNAEVVEVSGQALRLQEAYLEAEIVSPKWETDALHVAIASVSSCRVIVSWNSKHIVNFAKISRYNGINTVQRYNVIAVHTPKELLGDEEDI